ncbi:glyoxylate reductase/hydroxypyruvate reductase-like [Melitaea cinxia]|uniref:glyoxylate reductase/hydroxypyruvate reductase-like n=1 Tax=Melitaea cinxia TaxID=113334 RepID=UPI001E273FB7|nr:glyoxylate reductase/hydroxypyruvate reductase-like [Melitaea cinxia]
MITDLIEIPALYAALRMKKIFAAGIDNCTLASIAKDHKLLELNNIIVLPNTGASAERVLNEAAVLAAKNVVNGLTGKPLITPVLP